MQDNKENDIITILVSQVQDKFGFMNLKTDEILSVIKGKMLNCNTNGELINSVLNHYYTIISTAIENDDFTYVHMCVNSIISDHKNINLNELNMLGDFFHNTKADNIKVFNKIISRNQKLDIVLNKFIELNRNSIYKIIDNLNTISLIESYCDAKGIEINDIDEFQNVSNNSNDILKSYLNDIGKFPLLTLEQEKKLAVQYKKNGDSSARDTLIQCNLKLVISVAKHYAGREVSILDLISEGNVGLMRAIDKYDPEKGYRLSTYAVWWIRQAISRAYYNQCRNIRIPVFKLQKLNEYINRRDKLTNQFFRELSFKEIAQQLDMSINEVLEYESLINPTVSMETKVGEDSDSELGEFLCDDAPSVEDVAMKKTLNEELLKILDSLDERGRMVISLRYGLYDGKSKTLEETALCLYKMGITETPVTRERIRQIESKALRKLRLPKNSQRIKSFLD